MSTNSKRKVVKTPAADVVAEQAMPDESAEQQEIVSVAVEEGVAVPVAYMETTEPTEPSEPTQISIVKKLRGRQPKGGKVRVDPEKIERLPGLIKAPKLRSPEFSVYGVVGFHKDTGEPHICIEKHDGHGLFSKDWISFADIANVLNGLGNTAFSSGILKPLFRSASANNTGFLAALLRSHHICFLTSVTGSKYKHSLDDKYQQNLTALKSKAMTAFTSYRKRHPIASSEA